MRFLFAFFGHLKTVCKHKFWVGMYCFKAGLSIQGITHDLSKFSFTEFSESVKYYTGTSSPVETCKQKNGYSLAWLHHKGRNKHHYVYWIDNLDSGGVPIPMPYKYALEMICDWLGACRAYENSKDDIYEAEYNWWLQQSSKIASTAIHYSTREFINVMLRTMYEEKSLDVLTPRRSLNIYRSIYGYRKDENGKN